MVLLTREQIEARLVALHRASLALVSDLSLGGGAGTDRPTCP